jgi:preprotein translocase subunit SecE
MATIGRKEPVAPPPTRERAKPRAAAAAPEAGRIRGPVERLRKNIDDIASELRKVTWPTRDETRNLTIVVIGISAVLGLFLGGIDLVLSSLYTLLNP